MKYLKLFEAFEDNESVVETLETILSLVKSGKSLSSKLNGGTVMDLHDKCSDPQVMEILSNVVDVISQEVEGNKVDATQLIDTNELEGIIRILKANPEKSSGGMKPVKESHNKSVDISEDEMNLFSDEPALQELISKNKITLRNGKVLFDESDEDTKTLLDVYLELPGKIEESTWNVYDKTHPNEIVREIFGDFNRSKEKHMDEVRNIINKVAKIQSSSPTKENERYLKELHNYYETLHYVPANLFKNIHLDNSFDD
jgi:hypothetical protein